MNGVSLIIPIYNVEMYIKNCLQSVVDSMKFFTNIQVILVDDESLDNSGEIARNYAELYPNFLYLKKENGGLSDARNYGLSFAEYEYVAFLDSDDYIAQEYFVRIFEALQKKPDLIIFDWIDVVDNQHSQQVKGMDIEGILWSVQPSTWNKVYKTSLFEEVKFPAGRIYEDVGTTYKLLHYTKSYLYLQYPLYNYRKKREGSILSTIPSDNDDLIKSLEDTYSFYIEQGAFSKENKEGLCYQYVKLLIWSDMYRQLQIHKLNFWVFYRKMRATRDLIYTRFPEWKGNLHLKRNIFYFESRLGKNYVGQLDSIGKSPFISFKTTLFLIVKNRKKLSKTAS